MARRYFGCIQDPMGEYTLMGNDPGAEIALRVAEKIGKHKIRIGEPMRMPSTE